MAEQLAAVVDVAVAVEVERGGVQYLKAFRTDRSQILKVVPNPAGCLATEADGE